MSTQPGWRLAHAIAWREFDGEIVVYHDGTGSTHHLGSLGSAVLRALAAHASGIGIGALVHELGIEADPHGDAAADAAADVEHALDELAELKIAIPVAA